MKNNGEYTMVEKVFVTSGEEGCRTVARRTVVVVERGRKEGRVERCAANENGNEGASVDFRRR